MNPRRRRINRKDRKAKLAVRLLVGWPYHALSVVKHEVVAVSHWTGTKRTVRRVSRDCFNGERLMLTPPPIRRPERVYAVLSRNNIDFDYSSGEAVSEVLAALADEVRFDSGEE